MVNYCFAVFAGIPVALPLAFYIYVHSVAKKPRLYAKSTRFKELIKLHCKSLAAKFTPTWWCPFGNMQTAVRNALRNCPTVQYEREILKLKDGGQVALDWLHSGAYDNETPIVLILPGLTGTSRSCYVLHVVLEIEKLGYIAVIFNRRGTAGVKLLTPRAYCAAETDDTDAVIRYLNAKYPKAPILAVGFSQGGVILFNYVCTKRTSEETGIKAALLVSIVWEWELAGISFLSFWPRFLFHYRLGTDLVNLVRPYQQLFESKCDWSQVLKGRTVRDFDKHFTVPIFGYKDLDEFYSAAAVNHKVHRVPVPMLCLNAADDCFAPLFTIPFDEIENSDNVAIITTTHGGHMAFMKHFSPNEQGLIEELFAQYAKMVFNHL